MRRKKDETFKHYVIRRRNENLRIKKHLQGNYIHISKYTLKKKEKGITYLKPQE